MKASHFSMKYKMLFLPLIMEIISNFGILVCTNCFPVQKKLRDNYMLSPNACTQCTQCVSV